MSSHLFVASAVFLILVALTSVQGTCLINRDTIVTCSSLIDLKIYGSPYWTSYTGNNYGNESLSTLQTNSFLTTPNLKRITITGLVNNIEFGAFDNLNSLEFISLEQNKLSDIPPGFFANLTVQHLAIYDCGVRNLIKGFLKDMPNLISVKIQRNPITTVTKDVFSYLNITQLRLPENEISVIEEGAFVGMKNLTLLYLFKNKLTTFEPERLIGHNPTLIRLWLYSNLITKVTKSMFKGLENLEVINLSNNSITSIEAGSFQDTKSVYLIDLSYNLLENINPQVFPMQGAQNVSKLYVHNNRLMFLSSGLLTRLPNLKYIQMGGNPWQCPCLKHIISWLDYNNVIYKCDKNYFLGDRPVCFVSPEAPKDCIYDLNSSRELARQYINTLSEYPKLPFCVQ